MLGTGAHVPHVSHAQGLDMGCFHESEALVVEPELVGAGVVCAELEDAAGGVVLPRLEGGDAAPVAAWSCGRGMHDASHQEVPASCLRVSGSRLIVWAWGRTGEGMGKALNRWGVEGLKG